VQNSFGLYSFISIYIREKKGSSKLNFQLLLLTVKYYANYFYFKLPAHLLYAISAQMPIIYASKYFGMTDVGYLSLAISMVALPIAAFSRSINKVYYSEVSSIGKNKPKEIYNVTIKLIKKLFVLGVLMSFTTFVLSPWVFSFILGESWNDSGNYARALSIGLIFQISATTIIMVLNVINLNAFSFFIHLVRFFVISLSFYISYVESFSLLNSIYAYSVSISLFYLFVIISIILILKKNVLKKGEG
jgi:O-antigen/teichoic acid export membrane protein